ncbi:MAG: SPOR domain-containing protein [Sulfuritalea sp.]|nr:SPOR domain-containing protein [Sulfuritalea sp.]
MAIRLVFFLLVFANLLFLAWAQGYLGASDDGHEPQRLAQQLNPEKLRIVRDAQKPEVQKDDTICRLINGLKVAEAETLGAAVEANGGKAKILPLAEPALYLVVISDLANKAAADRKAAELTRLGVEGHSSVALEGGRHEIVFGSFPAEAAARELLQGLARRGIKSALSVTREQPALKARVETRAPASTLLQQLPKLIAPYANAIIGECAS